MQCDRAVVVHSFKRWLPQTEVWQYGQLSAIPRDINNIVVCRTLENIDQFGCDGFDNLKLHSELSPELSSALSFAIDNLYERGRSSSRLKRHNSIKKWSVYLQDKNSQKFLFEQIANNGAQILHSHFGNRGWLNIGAARNAKVKHVVSFYGMDLGYLPASDMRWRDRYRKLFRSASLVLVEGPHMASLVKNMGCPERKVRIHRLGVMLDRLPFRPRRKLKSDPLRILIAASFREKKGITYAVEAVKRFSCISPVAVTIIGDDNGSPQSIREKQRILKAIENSGLAVLGGGFDSSQNQNGGSIRLMGFLTHEQLLEEAYEHHVFLSPSVMAADGDIEGGAPMTIIEMAATGMMLVSTRHCDIPQVIDDGKTGFLADEGNVDGLVKHLLWLNENPGSWKEIAKASRRHVEQNFCSCKQGLELAAIYRELRQMKS